MNDIPFKQHPASDSAATRLESSAFHVVVEFGRISIGRRELENRPFDTIDRYRVSLAQSRRRLDERIEYDLKIECRAADHLRTSAVAVCCCSDSRSSLRQAGILDCDDGLVGEGPEKGNLLIRKRINFGTSKLDCSDRHPLAQQWTPNVVRCPNASRKRFLREIPPPQPEVEYVNRLALKNGAACHMPARTREADTDVLRDRTPVGHRT